MWNVNLNKTLMVSKKFFFLILIFQSLVTLAQDAEYARHLIDTLASESMHGRGYVKGGERKSAELIGSEFRKSGLAGFDGDYFQTFTIAINTFPDPTHVMIDGQELKPGREYVVLSSSPSINGTFNLAWKIADSATQKPDSSMFVNEDFSEKIVVTNMNQKEFEKQNLFGSKGYIFLMENKVWWHVSNGTSVHDYFQMQILKSKMADSIKTISIQAQNKFVENYPTQNVVGFVKGTNIPDSFFVFTAHYDHLGMMGPDTYFPGANDNASGTAMLLDLARYYSSPGNNSGISIVFIAFSAEEVGLIGSEYFTEHPLFPLEKIKFLVNLDMVGSGSEGIKVVNGTVFKKEFEILKNLNKEKEYLLTVSERGEAANSDHYPFYAKGVPCFFIYTLGKECKEYHNVYDNPASVPLTEYADLFRLLIDFQSFFD